MELLKKRQPPPVVAYAQRLAAPVPTLLCEPN